MLSQKIIKKKRILLICDKSVGIRSGDSFKGVELIDPYLDFISEQTNVICYGSINEEEMLFRSDDGRYYFSVKDGWGVEDNKLYGVTTGFFMDFMHSTAEDTIISECRSCLDSYNYNSWAGALAYNVRKNTIIKIISFYER